MLSEHTPRARLIQAASVYGLLFALMAVLQVYALMARDPTAAFYPALVMVWLVPMGAGAAWIEARRAWMGRVEEDYLSIIALLLFSTAITAAVYYLAAGLFALAPGPHH